MGKPTIVTYHGDVETTSFFMTQLEKQLKAEDFEVCPLYYDAPEDSPVFGDAQALQGAFFLTFNFAGIYSADGCFLQGRGDDSKPPAESGIQLVDAYDMKCINIIVDHPYHYHDFLYEQMRLRRKRYFQICIDRQHIAYMKRYFPEIQLLGLMPSGGTAYESEDFTPGYKTDDWNRRPIDLLFAGTYVPPEGFELFIGRNGAEYSEFYHSMLDEALAEPEKKLEDIVRRRLEEEVEGGISEEEIRLTLGHIQFLDYYVRYRRRGELIRFLADWEPEPEHTPEERADRADAKNGSGKRGLHITIVGSGWEGLMEELKHPERVTLLPYADSQEILRLLTQSKFSLNILPSFHEGAHDRIFNSMLCGAVCVTDSNAYLDAILKQNHNAILYQTLSVEDRPNPGIADRSKKDVSAMAERLYAILREPKGHRNEIETIRRNALKTGKEHTWCDRAKMVAAWIHSLC